LILSLNSIKRRDVVIVGACRTAIGDFRDSKRYKALPVASKGTAERASIPAEIIDEICHSL